MAIQAKQRSVIINEYGSGKYQYTTNFTHSVNGKDVFFGHAVETHEGRTFYLDGVDAAYSDYPAFEAAYYARFPERKVNP